MNREAPVEQSLPAEFGISEAITDGIPGAPGPKESIVPVEMPREDPSSPKENERADDVDSPTTASLEAMLESMRSFRPELAVTLDPPVASVSEELLVETVLPRSMLRSGLDALLLSYPLTGILHAPSGKRVVMGAFVFSEGDSPEPGAVIERIEVRAVWFKYGGESLRVALPALQIRASSAEGRQSTGDESSSEETAQPGSGSESEALPTDGV